MEDLIMNAHILYDEQHISHSSPPLPPTPAGEPVPHYAYGSKTTKVANMPATPVTVAGLHPPPSPQDFTPKLPPRPTNSIHPSLRAGPVSPTRGRAEAPPLSTLRQDQLSFEETPPPSPSATSTVFGTDDAMSQDQDIHEQSAPSIPSMRPHSPLQQTIVEMADTQPHSDAAVV